MPTARKQTRKRRTAEGARQEILEAAERRLVKDGPGALRLQELAADVGVSHPALLHHFGSREGLVRAVVQRAVRTLQDELVTALDGDGGAPPDPAQMLTRVAETLGDKGHARLIAWLLLSGHDPFDADEVRARWREIIRRMHALRVAAAPKGSAPTEEDTAFTVVLPALALFAEAIAGTATFQVAGLGRTLQTHTRFRAWLGTLLAEHLAPS